MKVKKSTLAIVWLLTVIAAIFATLWVSDHIRGEMDVPLAVSDDPLDYLGSTRMVPITPDITARAWAIVGGEQDQGEQARLIHSSIARNQFYDRDSVRSGTVSWSANQADSVYENRRGVCEGYSNLEVAFLRAVGIPARKVICRLTANGSQILHSYAAAYWDGEWHLMDVTFDSRNVYQDETWVSGNQSREDSLAWFDVEPEVFFRLHGEEIFYAERYY